MRPVQYTEEGTRGHPAASASSKSNFIDTPEALIAARKGEETQLEKPKTNGDTATSTQEKPKEASKAIEELAEKRKQQVAPAHYYRV